MNRGQVVPTAAGLSSWYDYFHESNHIPQAVKYLIAFIICGHGTAALAVKADVGG